MTYRLGQGGPASAEAQQRATRGAPDAEHGRSARSGPSLPPCHPVQRPRHQPEQRETSRPEGGEKGDTSGTNTNIERKLYLFGIHLGRYTCWQMKHTITVCILTHYSVLDSVMYVPI